jgi:hypothetical protein
MVVTMRVRRDVQRQNRQSVGAAIDAAILSRSWFEP